MTASSATGGARATGAARSADTAANTAAGQLGEERTLPQARAAGPAPATVTAPSAPRSTTSLGDAVGHAGGAGPWQDLSAATRSAANGASGVLKDAGDNVGKATGAFGTQVWQELDGRAKALEWVVRSADVSDPNFDRRWEVNRAVARWIRDNPAEATRVIGEAYAAPVLQEWNSGNTAQAVGRATAKVMSLLASPLGPKVLMPLAQRAGVNLTH